MTKAEIRRLFEMYDRAGKMALGVRDRSTVVGHPHPVEQLWLAAPAAENSDLVDMLDELRRLIRERIETEASGKAVSR